MPRARPVQAINLPGKRWFWPAFSLVAFILVLITMDFKLNNYDEGLSLFGAVRVLHGQLPYKDFWTMYGPGEFYLLAAMFRVFGVSAFCDRWVYAVASVITLAAIFHIAHSLTLRTWLAVLATAMGFLAVAGINTPVYAFPIHPALAGVMVAAVCFILFWRTKQRRFLGAAGVAVGCAALFRHDIGFYATAALLISNAYFRRSKHVPTSSQLSAIARDCLWFFAGLLIITLPPALYLLSKIPLRDIDYSLFYVPARIYPRVRTLPFPNPLPLVPFVRNHIHPAVLVERNQLLGELIVYLPIVVVVATIICLLPQRSSMHRWQATTYLMLTLLVSFMFLKGIVRVSSLHMMQAVIPAVLLLCCAFHYWSRSSVAAKTALVCAGLALAVCTGPATLFVLHRATTTTRKLLQGQMPDSFSITCGHRPGLDVARCLTIDKAESDAALYLEQHTTTEQAIFVGAGRHDMLFANNITLYFLAQRQAATKWHDLHPGVETTAPIQREMISQFASNHAVYVIRNTFVDNLRENNDSSRSSGVLDLDRYIDANYKPEASFGTIHILHRTTNF